MQFQIQTPAYAPSPEACRVIGIFADGRLALPVHGLDAHSRATAERALKSNASMGVAGRTQLLLGASASAPSLLLAGLGEKSRFGLRTYRNVLHQCTRVLGESGVKEAAVMLATFPLPGAGGYELARHAAESIEDADYRFDACKSKASKQSKPTLQKITLLAADSADLVAARRGLRDGQAIAAGVTLARDLGNLPANICTPGYLANAARKLGNNGKLRVKVLEEAQMKKLGMGALLAVAQGSRQPAKLIIMEYRGGPKTAQPLVLVGKGITFDSGGISIKPAAAMDEMKFDMCGAASVFGALKASMQMGLKRNVIGIVPSAENLPGGSAVKPGDIVTTLSGQTVEILNTDAEGRLILCDALAYARRFKPAAIVDMATLTGACVIALGKVVSGLFGNDDGLVKELWNAGEKAGDRAWQLPLYDEYQEGLKSNFADFANVSGREGGAITAACYLSRFTQGLRWAHLDIAGTAWESGTRKGATGRPVPLLVQYLLDRA